MGVELPPQSTKPAPADPEPGIPPVRLYRRGRKAVLWVRAEMSHLTVISDFLTAWLHDQEDYRDDPGQRYQVELAVIEACTNIIRHGEANRAEPSLCLSLRRQGPLLDILIIDRGIAFDPSEAPVPDLGEPGEGGYGIFLIRQLMNRMVYERRGKRWNCLRLWHRVPPGGANRTAAGPGQGESASPRGDREGTGSP